MDVMFNISRHYLIHQLVYLYNFQISIVDLIKLQIYN